MSEFHKKYHKLIFLVLSIYPIYLDIYSQWSFKSWLNDTFEYPFFLISLPRHAIFSVFLYVFSIGFLAISFVAIYRNHDIWKKLDIEYKDISIKEKVLYSFLFGLGLILITIPLDFISNWHSNGMTSSYLIGLSALGIFTVLITFDKKSNNTNNVNTKINTERFVTYLKIASILLVCFLILKPETRETHESKIFSTLRDEPSVKFKTNILEKLSNANYDNIKFTDEDFVRMKPYISDEMILTPECFPFAIHQFSVISNLYYPELQNDAVKKFQQFYGKTATSHEINKCNALTSNPKFLERARAVAEVISQACMRKLLYCK